MARRTGTIRGGEIVSQVVAVAGLILALALVQGCAEAGMLARAVTESVADTTKEVEEEYGKGALGTMVRGTGGVADLEPHRQRINNLFEDGRISRSERDARLASLFAGYDAYRAGEITRSEFDRRIRLLRRP